MIDASPLIFLARGELLELLKLLGGVILVPEPVASEILRRGPNDRTARALQTAPWIRIVEAVPVPAVIQNWDLGPGETSVLAWANAHSGSEAILDDLAARRCATVLNIPVRGTIGLVLAAKKNGRIDQASPVIEHLRRAGMYLSDRVINEALSLVGE